MELHRQSDICILIGPRPLPPFFTPPPFPAPSNRLPQKKHINLYPWRKEYTRLVCAEQGEKSLQPTWQKQYLANEITATILAVASG